MKGGRLLGVSVPCKNLSQACVFVVLAHLDNWYLNLREEKKIKNDWKRDRESLQI